MYRSHNDVIDECYKIRFYTSIFEYYFLHNDPKSFKTCRCPMANCHEYNFANPSAMLLHLKRCSFFPEGFFMCPTCGRFDRFRTDTKKCSWNRPGLRQRVHKKLKNAADSIRCFAGSCHGSGQSSPLDQCQECGRPFGSKSTDAIYSNNLPLTVHGLPVQGPLVQGFPKLYNNIHQQALPELPNTSVQELTDTSPLPELDADCGDALPNQTHSLPSNSPTNTTSTSVDQAGIRSTEVSPVSSEDSPKDPSPSYQASLKGTQSLPQILAQHDTNRYVEQLHNSWPNPQSTRPYEDAPFAYNSLQPVPYFDKQGFNGDRESMLIFQTNNLEPTLDGSTWERNLPASNGNFLDAMNITESPVPQTASSPLTSIGISSVPNLGAYVTPLITEEKGIVVQDNMPSDDFSPADSAVPSSSPDQLLNSELSETSLQCPHCDYIPRGKKENYKSYLSKHKRTHDNDQKCKCEVCGKEFTRPDNRGVHARKKHDAPSDSKRRSKRFKETPRHSD
ncbi:hypothetical protein F4677DRAFT_147675 [Hypoxylon crocopeplum]|nr:hypothetical protein F4677DRAFT_147675 [Hypoxylon crocopeplum]